MDGMRAQVDIMRAQNDQYATKIELMDTHILEQQDLVNKLQAQIHD